jgi:uncharacterized protein YbcI
LSRFQAGISQEIDKGGFGSECDFFGLVAVFAIPASGKDSSMNQPPPAASRERVADGDQSAAMQISNAMIRLYKELFGRGPTSARTEFVGTDTVLCTLRDSMTPAERSLVDMGEFQRTRDTRLYFQDATEDRFRGEVERILGRQVVAFMSAIDTREDVAIEWFQLGGPMGERMPAAEGP